MRYKGKHYWNYRIVTKLIKGQVDINLENPENNKKFPAERVFSIVEVYYNRDTDKPDSYTERGNIFDDHMSVKDLKWVSKKVKKAFKKPVLDLDNFPNEFHEKKD